MDDCRRLEIKCAKCDHYVKKGPPRKLFCPKCKQTWDVDVLVRAAREQKGKA